MGTTSQDFGLPQIGVDGFATLGANSSVPRGRVDTNTQLFGNVSYTAGKHNWKFGYEFRRTFVDGFFDSGYRGKLSFETLDDFIAGTPTGGRQAQGNSSRQTFQNNNSLYLQDSFHVSISKTRSRRVNPSSCCAGRLGLTKRTVTGRCPWLAACCRASKAASPQLSRKLVSERSMAMVCKPGRRAARTWLRKAFALVAIWS